MVKIARPIKKVGNLGNTPKPAISMLFRILNKSAPKRIFRVGTKIKR